MKKIKVGVIGMGYMGDAHARIYQAMPGVELVGCVEANEERRQEMVGKLGVPVYANTEELYLLGLDAVSICTPDQMHKEFVLEAFSQKVKVLVEKPLAMSLDDCREMIDRRPDPSYLMVGHDLRFDPRVVSAKRVLDSGQLGKLLLVNIRRSNSIFAANKLGGRSSIAWFLGIHDIDLVLWMTRMKVSEIGGVIGFKYYSENWDYTSAQMKLDGETVLIMENHWLIPNTHRSQMDAGVKIIGTKGMLEVDLDFIEVAFTPVDGDGTRYMDTHYQPDDMDGVPGGDLKRQLSAFITCVTDNKIPPTTGEDGFEAAKVIAQIEEKLRTFGFDLRQ